MSTQHIVIVGASTAGLQLAVSLREGGHSGPITLVGEEPQAPYHRPPLSKAYMLGDSDEARLAMRPANFYEARQIDLRTSLRAVHIARAERKLQFDDGSRLAYDHLVLATGARNRLLPVEGAGLAGVRYLRTLDEAQRIKQAVASVREVVVIGAGFIGLEFAAVARKLGLAVTVVDVAERAMARAVSPDISALFERAHRAQGTQLLFKTTVQALEGKNGQVTGVQTGDGRLLPCQMVVVGIGVLPNAELAQEAGLAVDNGIVVDERMHTADPHISAIGDCAAHLSVHAGGARVRIESVQNAGDQARCLAADLTGQAKAGPYRSVPWFWSDQGDLKLQMAGWTQGTDHTVLLGDAAQGPCSVYCFRQQRLIGVETVNRPGEHLAARKLLALMSESNAAGPSPQAVAAPGFDLLALVRSHPAG